MNSTNTDIQAFSEVKCILDFLPINYTEKLPKKLLNIIDSLYDEKFKVNINPNIELKNQNFTEDTKNIIAVLKYNYWCKDDEEKENLARMFKKNEDKYQEDLREKYNPDNIFKNRKNEDTESNNLPVVIKKENLFIKALNFIKDFFRNKR
ncbi:MAG: hypothetical protein IKT41_01765 [Clostridia bacterium]|nr:hypothetical protein [Clostridia bacterium]